MEIGSTRSVLILTVFATKSTESARQSDEKSEISRWNCDIDRANNNELKQKSF
jgi:hypothetical protein